MTIQEVSRSCHQQIKHHEAAIQLMKHHDESQNQYWFYQTSKPILSYFLKCQNPNQINSRYVKIFSTTLSLVPDNVPTLTKTD